MLCEKCGLNPATVQYTQIINGVKTSAHLCAECANQDAIFHLPFSLPRRAARAEDGVQVCPTCAMTLREFAETGLPGCGTCYTAFESVALPLLRRMHTSVEHIGRGSAREAAPSAPEPQDELTALRAKLKTAIAAEDFETAAKLRDEIKAKEEEGR